jgi:hypothetical protein
LKPGSRRSRTFTALRTSRATVRFETEPGRQAQLDWGEIRTLIAGVETKVYFSAVTLGFARRTHAYAFERLDAEHCWRSSRSCFVVRGAECIHFETGIMSMSDNAVLRVNCRCSRYST